VTQQTDFRQTESAIHQSGCRPANPLVTVPSVQGVAAWHTDDDEVTATDLCRRRIAYDLAILVKRCQVTLKSVDTRFLVSARTRSKSELNDFH
jgi:hypothetical protein